MGTLNFAIAETRVGDSRLLSPCFKDLFGSKRSIVSKDSQRCGFLHEDHESIVSFINLLKQFDFSRGRERCIIDISTLFFVVSLA